ncbi:hypothetical protein T484DRAFT_1969755 [Baffinella frigidus]|nr:hypothetical protein T484DRAFT_1969755 [Cryptophyta sp. CCMP2293]
MAGLSNRAVAVRLLALLVQDARGISAVVYFDVGRKTWTVLSQSGRSWSHSSSPIHERDAFVYFDESRCRGTDMKLKADAVAFLTAGPGMCKDKLMQGAARMRQLDKGQQLIFGLAPDVAVKVASANTLDPAHPLCPTHLLRWVMHNTTNATEAGIQEWAAQGSYFATTKGANSQHRALPEVLALEDLYAEKVGTENVCKVVFRSQMRLTARLTAPLAAAEEDIMLGIKGRSDALGGDIEVVATGLEEECEREVECERELEKEVERQVPRKTPCSETLWSPQSLSAALAAAEPSADGGDAPGVFVTRNFFETIEERAPAPALGCYLRPLDAVLEFRTGALLLLSESEADQLLPPFWALEAHAQPALGTRLVNLCYLRDRAAGAAPRLGLPTRAAGFLSESGASVAHARACASLFAGGTMFDAEACRAVEKMLESAEARRWARDLTQLRGTQLLFERSNLQEICGFVSGRV